MDGKNSVTEVLFYFFLETLHNNCLSLNTAIKLTILEVVEQSNKTPSTHFTFFVF